MQMIPPMERQAILAGVRDNRYILVMRDEANWAIFEIERDVRRGSDVVVVDAYPTAANGKYMWSESAFGLYEYGDGESVPSGDTFVYVHSKTIVAMIKTKAEAETLYHRLLELDRQFAEATAAARVVYQMGALVAIAA